MRFQFKIWFFFVSLTNQLSYINIRKSKTAAVVYDGHRIAASRDAEAVFFCVINLKPEVLLLIQFPITFDFLFLCNTKLESFESYWISNHSRVSAPWVEMARDMMKFMWFQIEVEVLRYTSLNEKIEFVSIKFLSLSLSILCIFFLISFKTQTSISDEFHFNINSIEIANLM